LCLFDFGFGFGWSIETGFPSWVASLTYLFSRPVTW
jgi:hypothetical protein